ncbi:MAG: flagellar protein FliS [Acidobacteriota bacterium]
MNNDPFKSYRANTVRGTCMADVYIQCYDEIIRLLHSAARAIESGDIEKKTLNLNRAISFIAHLQAALDLAPGDESIQWLNHFYVLVRKQIFEGSARLDAGQLRQAAGYLAEVRKTWEEARGRSSEPASSPTLSPHDRPFHSPQEAAPAIASDMPETSSHTGWTA